MSKEIENNSLKVPQENNNPESNVVNQMNNPELNHDKNDLSLKNNEKEIIKKILSQILQDNNILNELKKRFGDDVSLKLLEGGFDINEINNIYDFLNKYENNINKNEKEKNLFRGSKHYYKNYKHDNNNNNDILLLRGSKRNNNEYHDFYDYEYDNCNHIPFSDEY